MNLDQYIIILYLVLTMVIGLCKRKKAQTLNEYALGDKNYSTFAVVATIFATFIGGGATIGIIEQIHQTSIIFGIIFFGQVIQKIIIAKFIAPNIEQFSGAISSGDLLGQIYGKKSRKVTGIIAFLVSMGMVTAQVSAIGYVVEYYLHFDRTTGIYISAGIVVLYSALGGMKSVIATDIFQFLILIIAFPLICNLGLTKIGGYGALFQEIPKNHLSLPDNKTLFYVLPVIIYFSIPFEALMAQRILIAKSADKTRRSMYICAAIEAPFLLVIAIIGLLGLALYPDLPSKLVLPHLVNDILPSGFRGFAIAGILAVIMSTADSNLNTGAISFVNDIMPKLNSEKKTVFLAKLVSVIGGMASVLIAIYHENVLDIIANTLSIWSATVMLPLFLGLLNVKIRTQQLYICIFLGILSLFACNNLELLKDFSALISTLVNALSFFAFLLINRRSAPVKRNSKAPYSSKPFRSNPQAKIKLLAKQCLHIISDKAHESGAQYKTFGGFIILSFIFPTIIWSNSLSVPHYNIIVFTRILSAVIAFGLIMHDSWPKKLKIFLPIYWYASILYILPFNSIFMLISNNGEIIWWFNLAVSIYLVTILTDWFICSVLLVLGLALGYLFAYYILGTYEVFIVTINLEHIHNDVIYLLALSFLIGLIFSRNRSYVQRQIIEYKNTLNKKLEEKTSDLTLALSVKNRFLKNIDHELRTPLHALTNISSGLIEHWEYFSEEDRMKYVNELKTNTKRLSSLMKNLLDFSSLQSNKLQVDLKPNDLVAICKALVKKHSNVKFSSTHQRINILCDKLFISQAINELLDNAYRFSDGSEVIIRITHNKLLISDKGIGIPKGEEKQIFEPFFESSRSRSKAGGRGLGLAVTQAILTKHNWKIRAFTSSSGITSFEISFH